MKINYLYLNVSYYKFLTFSILVQSAITLGCGIRCRVYVSCLQNNGAVIICNIFYEKILFNCYIALCCIPLGKRYFRFDCRILTSES